MADARPGPAAITTDALNGIHAHLDDSGTIPVCATGSQVDAR